MNQNLKYYLLSLLLILSISCFFSCEKEIELDLKGNKKLVLLSNFTPDSLFKLYLSTSFINTDNNAAPSYPQNANIRLFENGIYLENFIYQRTDPNEIPFYFSNVQPRAGMEYSISAEVDNYPSIKSNNIIPTKPIIENFQLIESTLIEDDEFPGFFDTHVKFNLKLPHDNTQPKYYHLRAKIDIFLFDVIGVDTFPYFLYTADIPLNFPNDVDFVLTQHEPEILFDSSVFTESPDGIEISTSFPFDPLFDFKTPIYLEVRQVSKDYYLFHKSVGEQENTNFSNPILPSRSVLIHNNIENGIGNFSGYNVTVDSLTW